MYVRSNITEFDILPILQCGEGPREVAITLSEFH